MSYLGHDVLELNYNRVGAFEERLRRKFVLLSSKTGRRIADEQAPAPAASRPFTWTAIGRDEITTMRTFLDARRGRAIPFWLPSFQWDLGLADDVSQNQSSATIWFAPPLRSRKQPAYRVGHGLRPQSRTPCSRQHLRRL